MSLLPDDDMTKERDEWARRNIESRLSLSYFSYKIAEMCRFFIRQLSIEKERERFNYRVNNKLGSSDLYELQNRETKEE